MASIRERTSAGVTTHQVLYRHGGRQGSKTFRDRKAAERWKARINLDGIDSALAWLAEQKNPKRIGIPLDELAEQWFAARENDVKAGDLTPRVLTGYRRD